MEPAWRELDSHTSVVFLHVPAAKLVVLQALFETYEGLGLVRTLDMRRGLISILAAPDMQQDCTALLKAVWEQTGWRNAAVPDALERDLLFGYFKKESHA
ncbi:MAG: DUF4911 domain-containing protein [Deltaproteobacteria bacterium]|nr:DUF4911 domain-containing protein [Deltaproteobacteria bacterium]